MAQSNDAILWHNKWHPNQIQLIKQHAQQLINHFTRRVQIMLYIDQNAAPRGLGVGTISWLHVC